MAPQNHLGGRRGTALCPHKRWAATAAPPPTMKVGRLERERERERERGEEEGGRGEEPCVSGCMLLQACNQQRRRRRRRERREGEEGKGAFRVLLLLISLL